MPDAPSPSRGRIAPLKTLPGMGPRVSLDALKLHLPELLRSRVDHFEESWLVEIMNTQLDRYRWFARLVDPSQPLDRHAQILMGGASSPGALEAALVSLSVSDATVARAMLSAWQAPEHDLELAIFHQICLAEAFARLE